jgi:hypothetical protein
MKILHIIFSLCRGGAENMLIDIINEQVKTQNNRIIHPKAQIIALNILTIPNTGPYP